MSLLVVFVITPESRAVLLGEEFRLDCAAFEANNEPLTYSWEFNGQPIYISTIASKVRSEYIFKSVHL